MLDRIKGFLGIGANKELSEFTVIGKGSKFEGRINTGKLYIEGEFYPTHASSFSVLQIGESGVFKCEKETTIHNIDTIEIAGYFNGTVVANNIHIHKGATVKGTLKYKNEFVCDGSSDIDATLVKLFD